jgi:sec-independent protein translocase protein TatA
MFSFSMPELVLILVIALVVFGPGKLPEVGKALGKGIQEFRKATTGESSQDTVSKTESKMEEKK